MWWLSAASLLVVGLVVYVGSALHVLNFGPAAADRQSPPAGSSPGGQAPMTAATRADEQVRRQAGVQTVRLWPGEPAAALPIDVPVPAAASVYEGSGGMLDPARPDRLALTGPGDLSDLIATFRTELRAGGWQEVRSWMSRPVDATAGPASVVSAFCRSADGPALLVAIVSTEVEENSIHLRVYPEQPGPCAPDGPGSETDPWNGNPPPLH